MTDLKRARHIFKSGLQGAVLFLMVALAAVVLLGVGFRKFGAALVWYDEIASILLAWLTYYGAALAALERQHIGFPKIVENLPTRWRLATLALGEVIVIAFFALMAWSGWIVFLVLQGETLTSLPWLPLRVTQSVIPVGAVLYIIAELLSLPEVWREASGRREPGTESTIDVAGPAGPEGEP